jgi:D-galactarolactone isomerase
MVSNDKHYVFPEKACNAHLHIIDPAFPNNGKAEKQKGTVEEYKKIASELGIPRAVFVQAKVFGTDNACLVDAIQKFGKNNAVGIAVVNNTVDDAQLKELDAAGIKGLRFSVWNPKNAVVSLDDCLPLSKRVADLGWCIQLHMSAAQLVEHKDMIREIPCSVVIDHMGRLNPELGTEDPAFDVICSLVEKGNIWVKLCGPYLNTKTSAPWPDAAKTSVAYVSRIPERLVWGTDFPHVTEKVKYDEHAFADLIPQWISSEKLQKRILVENPKQLYDFK